MHKNSRLVAVSTWIASILLLIFSTLPPQERPVVTRSISFLGADPTWADQSLLQMSDRDKLAQLLWVELVPADLEVAHALDSLMKNGGIGGLMLKGFDRIALDTLVPRLQQLSPRPLMIGLSLGDPQPGVLTLPDEMGLGSLHRSPELLTDLAKTLAWQAHDLGIQAIFLPSLAEGYVAEKSAPLMEGLQEMQQVLDDHELLAIVTGVRPYTQPFADTAGQRILMDPYRQWIRSGLGAWTLAPHPTDHPAGYPPKRSALSDSTLKFRGISLASVPINGRDMEADFRSLLADGANGFCISYSQLADGREALESLIRTREVDESWLNAQVKKILLAKTWTGATYPRDTVLYESKLLAAVEWAQQRLAMGGISLLRNPDKLVPIGPLGGKAVHVLSMRGELPELVQQLRAYGPVSSSTVKRNDEDYWGELPVRRLRRFDPIILVAPDTLPDKKVEKEFWESLEELGGKVPLIVVQVGKFEGLQSWSEKLSLVHIDNLSEIGQPILAQALMGGVSIQGHLPLELGAQLPFGKGLVTSPTRLAYLPPLANGLDAQILTKIDTVIWGAIRDGAMPGCQVLVAHRGHVIWNRAYGYHTYAKRRPVYATDLYDIASMTKVAATTVATMHMVEQGKMSLSDPLKRFFSNTKAWIDTSAFCDTLYFYPPVQPDSVIDSVILLADEKPDSLSVTDSLSAEIESTLTEVIAPPSTLRVAQQVSRGQESPALRRVDTVALGGDSLMIIRTYSYGPVLMPSPVMNLTLAELLTHHSGLSPALPIYPYLAYRTKGMPRFGYYFQPREDEEYSIPVARQFYFRRDFRDSIWEATKAMRIDTSKGYRYSDANLVLVQQAIDSLNDTSLAAYLKTNLYEPLGMQQTGFLPLDWADMDRIVPTESDQSWRFQLLRGYVHDETAALMGGISGNAGLFANANDLGHLFQMLLNGGTYGGTRYMRPSIVQTFTSRQAGHRGYGFDLPPLDRDYYLSRYASRRSWGHTGFTGTCVWVDPEEELVYIFLSNRIHPRDNNGLINTLAVRQRVHDVVYTAIRSAEERDTQ